ncbi:MAG: MarR family transcriptional regulator, partial [Nocardia sp.]|nr:MarR family transcriptional regulator [Nocardia sp.]
MASESETSTLIEHFVLAVCDPGKWQGVDRLAELDLTLAQARVLFSVVRHSEPQPIHTIAGELGLSMTAAGRNVDRLVRLDLLTRQESPTDRRVKLVGPTEHGHRLAWDQIAIHRATIEKVVDRLPDPLREDLGRVLAAVL